MRAGQHSVTLSRKPLNPWSLVASPLLSPWNHVFSRFEDAFVGARPNKAGDLTLVAIDEVLNSGAGSMDVAYAPASCHQ